MKSYVYEYDNGGNITAKKTHAFRLGTLEEVQSTYTYSYGNSSWKDQLTSYRGTAITYDSLGNPLSYYNGSSYSFTWEKGRKLSRVQKGSSSFEFTYDESGHRIQKTSYADPIQYVWSGDRLIAEYREGYDTTIYLYDASGSPIGFLYRDNDGYYTGGAFVQFFYEKNLQGDIVGIIDSTGNKFVSYHYDAWGNLLKMEYHGSVGSFQANMAESNPFRYRGYYYDRETGFYYLNSRYYDPATGRFLNADDSDTVTLTLTELTDKNIYAYCDNNPIMRKDQGGEFWNWIIGAGVGAIAGLAGQIISDVVTSVLNGEITVSNWQTYTGAVVGGAVGGAILGGTGNVGAANVATGFVTTGLGQTLEKLTIDEYDKSWSEIGANAVADGVISYGLGKLPGVKGVTSGRNSMSAVYKSGLTKLRNDTAKHMSARVVGKGITANIVGGLALDVYYGVKQHAYDRVKKLLERWFSD